jgi:hypothetical protein
MSVLPSFSQSHDHSYPKPLLQTTIVDTQQLTPTVSRAWSDRGGAAHRWRPVRQGLADHARGPKLTRHCGVMFFNFSFLIIFPQIGINFKNE